MYSTRAIIGRSWLQATLEYKPYRIFRNNLLKNKEMVFERVKNIQAAVYNGACTVSRILNLNLE